MTFASRQDAGRKLAKFLTAKRVNADLVLGLPRGGVVVAAEIAFEFKLPLDVLAVRKIGHPLQREFAIGALAEPDFVFLDEKTMREFPSSRFDVDEIVAEEKERLRQYAKQFHFVQKQSLEGKNVLLVDDGLATGATAEAAIYSARQQKSHRITVAAPVASINAIEKLRRAADAIEVLHTDSEFQSVGQYYRDFEQTSDEEVISLLRKSRSR